QGAAGPREIEKELAGDSTAAGERNAASCRAAIPTAAAKLAAWEEIISGKLPNAVFRAMLSGFANPDQALLLEPFAERYFDVLADVWQDWSTDMAQWFAQYAYPST